jgi:hypothetical protein
MLAGGKSQVFVISRLKQDHGAAGVKKEPATHAAAAAAGAYMHSPQEPLLPRCTSTLLVQTGNVGDVKAAALDVSSPLSCVALFVGGGSSIETEETAGSSKLLEYMAFSATNAR